MNRSCPHLNKSGPNFILSTGDYSQMSLWRKANIGGTIRALCCLHGPNPRY